MTSPDQLPELPCRDVVEVITDYLEGTLPEAERLRLEAHLGECEDCAAYVEQIRVTIDGVEHSGTRAEALPPELREGVRQAFLGRLP